MEHVFSNIKSITPLPYPDTTAAAVKLYEDGAYTAFGEDLDFMWRWTIYRDKQLVQEGCSLTQDASRRAIEHVMAFFSISSGQSRQGVQP